MMVLNAWNYRYDVFGSAAAWHPVCPVNDMTCVVSTQSVIHARNDAGRTVRPVLNRGYQGGASPTSYTRTQCHDILRKLAIHQGLFQKFVNGGGGGVF